MQPEVAVAVFRACVAANLRSAGATLLAAAFPVQTAPDVRPNFRKSRVIIQRHRSAAGERLARETDVTSRNRQRSSSRIGSASSGEVPSRKHFPFHRDLQSTISVFFTEMLYLQLVVQL